MKLDKEELELVLYAIAKMIDIDGSKNREIWKELFLKLSNTDEKEISIGCPITFGEYENINK